MLDNNIPHVLVDVRPDWEVDICQLPTDFISILVSLIIIKKTDYFLRMKILYESFMAVWCG